MLISVGLKNDLFFRFSSVFFGFAVFAGVLFVDYIRRDSPDLVRISLISATVAIQIVYIWVPDSVELVQDFGITYYFYGGINQYLSVLLLLQGLYYTFEVFYSITKNTPPNMKQQSRLIFLGIFLFCVGTFVSYPFGRLIGLVIASAVGAILLGISLLLNIQIIYILPFIVHRLIVIEELSGIALFDYKWTKEGPNDTLLGGLITAINQFGLTVMQKGTIKEIILSEGNFLIYQSKHLIFGLLSSKSTNFLKENLKKFGNAFEHQFKGYIEQRNTDLSNYTIAEHLIKEYFPHIPVRYENTLESE